MKSYKFTINGNTYEVELTSFDDNIASIEVNGTPYEVEVHREVKKTKTPTIIRPSKPDNEKKNIEKRESGSNYPVVAPLPGQILEILVKKGDVVKKDHKLMVMESMKMENVVLAEKDGVVEEIKVKVGDSVLQGDKLIEIV